MRHHEEDGVPIVQRSYDLCVGLYGHVNRFPRAERGLLGRVLLDDALQLLTVLTVATRRTARAESLAEASGRLDALRIALRLSRRLGFLSNGGYEEVSKVADEVGRMLGGWLKHEGTSEVTAGRQKPADKPDSSKPRVGGVRYTMVSATIERYLRVRLQHPDKIVFLTVGAFCQTFFEDALACGNLLHLAVRNVAAQSEPQKILTCGIPKGKLEKYRVMLQQAGKEVHVE